MHVCSTYPYCYAACGNGSSSPSLVRVMLIALTVLMEERNAAGDVYRRCQKNIALVN